MKPLPAYYIHPVTLAICGGVLSVLFILFPIRPIFLSLIFHYFASAPLYYIGLTTGYLYLILASLVAWGLFIVNAGVLPAVIFAFTTIMPVLLVINRLARKDSLGGAVSWLAGYALLVLLFLLGIALLQSIDILKFLQTIQAEVSAKLTLKKVDPQIFTLLPGTTAVFWIVTAIVNAALAQKLTQKIVYNKKIPLKTGKFLDTVHLYDKWDIILASGILLMLTNSPFFAFMGKNIALISCIPLYLTGTKTLVKLMDKYGYSPSWTTGIILVSFLLVWPCLFIVIIGALEPSLQANLPIGNNRS